MANARLLAITVFALVIIDGVTAAGQDTSPATKAISLFQHEYPEVFDEFAKWNELQIDWTKQVYIDTFNSEIRRLEQGKAMGWGQARLELWGKLPNNLNSQLPISDAGQVMIGCYYAQNHAEFQKTSGEPAVRKQVIEAKLYLILSIAQSSAKSRKRLQIEPSDISEAFSAAWTGLWPFCPQK